MALSPKDFDNGIHALLWYLDLNDFYEKSIKPVLSVVTPAKASTLASLAIGGIILKCWALPLWLEKTKNSEFRAAIEIAQERREDEIEFVKEDLKKLAKDPEVQRIIELIQDGPMTIHRKLQDGSIKPTQVVIAYQHFMVIAQEKTNCLTNILTDAYEQAEALEKQYLGKPKPRLYGVIFSLKDMYDLEGRDSTVGLAKYLNQPKDRDCVIAQVLKKHGAIIIAKTGCPQTLISYGSGNPIYGTVNNPNSLSRGAGGSSSGEGALLAMNGSMAGAGSDLGGSVRIPSHFCGICGLRPMNGRLSAKDVLECIAGYRGIESTRGFLARDVDMLALVYSVALGEEMFKLDPQVPPIPWRPEIYQSEEPLRIGYFIDDGYFTPTPGVKRAVEIAISALRRMGHTVVPFDPFDSWQMMEGYNKLLVQDNGVQLLEQLYGEEIDICLQPTASLVGTINSHCFARKKTLLSLKHSSKLGFNTVKALFDVNRPVDVMKTFAERDIYRKRFIERWQKMKLDAIVCPATGTPALPPDVPPKLLYALSYTMRFNYLDFPAGIVPVTVENDADQVELESYRQDDSVYVLTRDAVRGAEGMPIGVQCAALPFQEEMALRVMRDIQNTAGKDMFMRPPILSTV